ncbi:D-alanine--D-alanine ligase [Corchorus olitorius]|uniref:D-alanine--D-alanine ligase n=1 Tax=Corchorus olitorius TaxID=93759 RepID=A0A1R3JS07_9ROSI|nr:D-alanine--D-alanine ligase [Corchorus olitorius]
MVSLACGSNLSLLLRRPNKALPSFSNLIANFTPKSLTTSSSSKAMEIGVGLIRTTAQVADAISTGADQEETTRLLRVGVICGGPSAERGISLNSARSVLDHIQGKDLHVSCYYIDSHLHAFAISSAQVYSNTPSDFDFKLESLAQGFESLSEFAEHLAASVDIVFPVIHGRFGEDGGIQELLETYNIPFVGTGSKECRQAFDKYDASLGLSKQGFVTVPSFLVQGSEVNESELSDWFASNQLDFNSGKVVVKPTRAGSSIGVTVAYGVADSLEKAKELISQGIDDRVLVELFLEGGSEFTAIILDVGQGFDCQPVVLLPTEVELQFHGSGDVREKDAIFNYRRKYLPTQQVAYHTPPRFPIDVIKSIREGASLLFKRLGLRDFARIDGWFLPSSTKPLSSSKDIFGVTESGSILFTDINLISGMEQTSFLFQQASKLETYGSESDQQHRNSKSLKPPKASEGRKGIHKVFVIFGGDTSERQVSLISGTNVWLNLQASDDLDVTPCLLSRSIDHSSTTDSDNKDSDDVSSREVWLLPYSLVLRHTTEEVLDACMEAIEPDRAALTSHLRNQVMNELMEGLNKHRWFKGFDIADEQPVKYSLKEWIKFAKEVEGTVFIAVHGGIGEDARDGCSTGVARLRCAEDLAVYAQALNDCLLRIPPNSFSKAHGMIEMPNPPPELLIFEPFVETDEIVVSSKTEASNSENLLWKGDSRWVEVTVGVIGKRGLMHSLSPSITVKESGDILSLEEKFQGGTGINLTPPPASIISNEALEKCKQRIELIANTLQLEGFSRIDAFVNVDSGEVLIIEVNTVPGMTPSTVLIHQALAEQPPMYPHQFFRKLFDLASERVL